ncbi:MAG: 50S ribosomal protein L32 [Elusimicrobia bacterium]|nr:50S ribosomal protein L32 [Elusimicrobiota bacterium]
MAVPKRRHSKARTRKRRSSKKIKPDTVSVCPQCTSPKLPHRICSECGYYGDKQIIKKD